MLISELIDKLNDIKKEHGDLIVAQYQWNDPNFSAPTKDVEVIETKQHHNDFVHVARLNDGGYCGTEMFNKPIQSKIKAQQSIKVVHIYY